MGSQVGGVVSTVQLEAVLKSQRTILVRGYVAQLYVSPVNLDRVVATRKKRLKKGWKKTPPTVQTISLTV